MVTSNLLWEILSNALAKSIWTTDTKTINTDAIFSLSVDAS